ncbi:hypothetical protein GCM10011586_37810 [Silvibacterium dinghuense]|nr:hypothetical protein GCM10011586_37810 [Silvibacterium dinghuense]
MPGTDFEASSRKTCKDYCIHCKSCNHKIPLIVLAVHVSQRKRGLVQIR